MSHESTPPSQAVALRYDGTGAPRVIASGEDQIAAEILRIAREHNIPLYENPELAAILSRLDLGDEVPDILYRVIAEILAFAFHLQGKTPEGFHPAGSEEDGMSGRAVRTVSPGAAPASVDDGTQA